MAPTKARLPQHLGAALAAFAASLKPPAAGAPDQLRPTPPPADLTDVYPPPHWGAITKLTWRNQTTVWIDGRVLTQARYRFYVRVVGDTEYLQNGFNVEEDGQFRGRAVLGRPQDEGRKFELVVALYPKGSGHITAATPRFGEIVQAVERKRGRAKTMTWPLRPPKTAAATGWAAARAWMTAQSLDALKSDNAWLKVSGGTLVQNYRFRGHDDDARFLVWHGRVTGYGTAVAAKAMFLRGEVKEATALLKVWEKLMDSEGRIPSGANSIGDNWLSPTVRTGETGHLLGAFGVARAVTGDKRWDAPITLILDRYLPSVRDRKSGLPRGGFTSTGGGYGPRDYRLVDWCSAEHAFDIYQAYVLLEHTYAGTPRAKDLAKRRSKLGKAIDKRLWDGGLGTFNRGWSRRRGKDKARALDCASWGALYWLKRARLAAKRSRNKAVKRYVRNARRALSYAEKHFSTAWQYKPLVAKPGLITGQRPYDGRIRDLLEKNSKGVERRIRWHRKKRLVWSEGTLGVVVAQHMMAEISGDKSAAALAASGFKAMRQLQALSDKGGVLYTTRRIPGKFARGEELASLGWLMYVELLNDKETVAKRADLLPWVPW
jgi:hypothetical protein